MKQDSYMGCFSADLYRITLAKNTAFATRTFCDAYNQQHQDPHCQGSSLPKRTGSSQPPLTVYMITLQHIYNTMGMGSKLYTGGLSSKGARGNLKGVALRAKALLLRVGHGGVVEEDAGLAVLVALVAE
eukprot:77912-Prorocentrum_minimum.AAC.1